MLKVNQFTAKGVKTSDFSLPKEMEVKVLVNQKPIRDYQK